MADYTAKCAVCHGADAKKIAKKADKAKDYVAALGKGTMATVKLDAEAAKAVCDKYLELVKK